MIFSFFSSKKNEFLTTTNNMQLISPHRKIFSLEVKDYLRIMPSGMGVAPKAISGQAGLDLWAGLCKEHFQCFSEIKYMSSLLLARKVLAAFENLPLERILCCWCHVDLIQNFHNFNFTNSNAKSLLKLFQRNTHSLCREMK